MHQPYTAPTLILTRPAHRLPHISAPIQPPQTNPPTTHKYQTIHTPQIPRQYSLHTHTASTKTHTLDAAQAPVDVDVDADDVPTLMQHRCSRIGQARQTGSAEPDDRIRNSDRPGRQDQAIQDQTGQDQTSPFTIEQARYQTDSHVQDQTRPGLDQVSTDQTRPAPDRP